MAITKSKGNYFTDNERVWMESHQLGVAPFRVGQWDGRARLPDHPTPNDLKPLFAGVGLPRVQHNRVGCYDLTFTASKAVSIVLYALTPPAEWAASARLVARAAVAQTEPLLEKLAVNHGAHGADKLPARGTGVCFPHFLSAAGAPHAHVHIAVPNLAVTPTGKLGSIANAKTIYDGHAADLAAFQKSLDDGLQRQGYKTVRVGKAVEVVGVPAQLIAELSPARAAMDEARQKAGFTGPKAADFYARQARRTVPAAELRSAAEHHADWSAAAKRHGITRESLRTRRTAGPVADRDVRRYSAFCTGRDALKHCTKKYGRFTTAQYREAVYLLGIGRPATKADLDKEVSRVLTRPKCAGVRRTRTAAGEDRYSTRSGEKARRAAERAFSPDAFDQLKASARKLAGTVLVKTAKAATAVLRQLHQWIDPAPVIVRLDGRSAAAFQAAFRPTGYLKAHAKALLAGLFAAGNPHERAAVAERVYRHLREHRRLPPGSILIVDHPDRVSSRHLRGLAKVARRDGASVVLAGVGAAGHQHERFGRDAFGPEREHDRR
jgi:conjugative relaxase-like TrwC/TraI family protein